MTLIDLEGKVQEYKYEIRPSETGGSFKWDVFVWADGRKLGGYGSTDFAMTLLGARYCIGKAIRIDERHQRVGTIKGTITRRGK